MCLGSSLTATVHKHPSSRLEFFYSINDQKGLCCILFNLLILPVQCARAPNASFFFFNCTSQTPHNSLSLSLLLLLYCLCAFFFLSLLFTTLDSFSFAHKQSTEHEHTHTHTYAIEQYVCVELLEALCACLHRSFFFLLYLLLSFSWSRGCKGLYFK